MLEKGGLTPETKTSGEAVCSRKENGCVSH